MPAGQIDILPAKLKQLTDAQAGQRERGERRPARHLLAIGSRLTVKLPGRVEHRPKLVGLQERAGWGDRLQATAATTGGIAVEQARVVLDREIENLRQALERRIDRGRVDHALADLGVAIAVDLGDRDLAEPMAMEERQQVMAQLPAVVVERRLPQLAASTLEPHRGELVKRRVPDDGRGRRRFRRAPQTSPHIRKDVLQLDLGLTARPAVPRRAEGDVLATAVGAKAQRERLALLELGDEHLTGGLTGHQLWAPPTAGYHQGHAAALVPAIACRAVPICGDRSRLGRLLNADQGERRGSVKRAHGRRARRKGSRALDGFPTLPYATTTRDTLSTAHHFALRRCQPSLRRWKMVSLPRCRCCEMFVSGTPRSLAITPARTPGCLPR